MKFSLKWLGDFIETEVFFKDPNKLAEALTQSGLEVDNFEDQKAQFQNVVTAQIESVQNHPQADRLTVCQVKTDRQIYSIVCGAKNHKAGDKVVLAKVGAILPGDFKIKKSRIRGVDSEGMLASRSELGFDSKEEGIWILPEKTELGKSLSELEGLDDIIFEMTAGFFSANIENKEFQEALFGGEVDSSKTPLHLMEEALKNIRKGIFMDPEKISNFTDNQFKDITSKTDEELLEEALENEDYEEAAKLRDKINKNK